jgi:hypothetical protein
MKERSCTILKLLVIIHHFMLQMCSYITIFFYWRRPLYLDPHTYMVDHPPPLKGTSVLDDLLVVMMFYKNYLKLLGISNGVMETKISAFAWDLLCKSVDQALQDKNWSSKYKMPQTGF